jgi:hypothetical protein
MAGNFDRLDQDANESLEAEELERSAAARGGQRGVGGGAQQAMDPEMQ